MEVSSRSLVAVICCRGGSSFDQLQDHLALRGDNPFRLGDGFIDWLFRHGWPPSASWHPSYIEQVMDGGGEEFAARGFGLGELGFQGVAEGEELGDFGDDALLLGKWRQRDDDILTLRHGDVVLPRGANQRDVLEKCSGLEVCVDVLGKDITYESKERDGLVAIPFGKGCRDDCGFA